MENTLLNGLGELSFAIEGRFTNLRIWSSKTDDNIYMRLERFNQYSVPLNDKTILYLNKPNDKINKLNELFGFNGAKKTDIDAIIDIVKDMKIRLCREW